MGVAFGSAVTSRQSFPTSDLCELGLGVRGSIFELLLHASVSWGCGISTSSTLESKDLRPGVVMLYTR